MPRRWIVPASSAFLVTASALLAALIVGRGCETRCTSVFDCGDHGYCSSLGRCEVECFVDRDCLMPEECRGNPVACQPRGLRCNSVGRCVDHGLPPRLGTSRPAEVDRRPQEVSGWDAPPGSGPAFIVNRLAIAPQGVGVDVNRVCNEAAGCADNALWRLGELGNSQIARGLVEGQTLLLLEAAGLSTPYIGEEPSMTLKMYGALDADYPPFTDNDFGPAREGGPCCEFRIHPQSLSGIPGQAKARSPARIENGGYLRSLAPMSLRFTIAAGAPPYPEIRIEQSSVTGRMPSSLRRFDDGVLGGAVPIQVLAQTANPYCNTVNPLCRFRFGSNSTLLDLVHTLVSPRPDVDLDQDGLECLLDTDGDGLIDVCCDGFGAAEACGRGAACAGATVAPLEPDKPWTCARRGSMADGYSVGMVFGAVRATIVGVGQ